MLIGISIKPIKLICVSVQSDMLARISRRLRENKKMIKTELIENHIKEHKLSKTKFCKMCKISTSTLTRIMDNENVSLLAILRITRILGIFLHQIFN